MQSLKVEQAPYAGGMNAGGMNKEVESRMENLTKVVRLLVVLVVALCGLFVGYVLK